MWMFQVAVDVAEFEAGRQEPLHLRPHLTFDLRPQSRREEVAQANRHR